MTIREAYQRGKHRLAGAGVPEADLDAWLLLEYVTGIGRAAYYADETKALTAEQIERYDHCIEQRTGRIPLQHITGVQEFMGLSFRVNEHVLIPRQDTECLVEEAADILFSIGKKQPDGGKVLDMCTGSGCILISLMKRHKISDGVGADVSADALVLAGKNASDHGVTADFIHSDLFQNIAGEFDLIVSNPPYIPSGVIAGLQKEVGQYDPLIALDGKTDGLHYYRRIIAESPAHLKKGGWLLLEIGFDQAEAVQELMAAGGFKDITVTADLSGLDRVVRGSVQ